MKITDVLSAQQFLNVVGTKNLPIALAYRVAKLGKQIAENQDFYDTKYKEYIDQYSEKDENGNPKFSEDGTRIMIQKDKESECMQVINDLQNLDIDIDYKPFKLEDFGQIDITPAELVSFLPFIEQ